MRRRDEAFIRAVREAIATAGLPIHDDQKCEIASQSRTHLVKRKAMIAFVDAKLRQPNIREALVDIFGTVGLTPLYLLEKHKQFIDGVEYEKVVVTPEGSQVIRVQSEPSYPALRDVMKLVFPHLRPADDDA